MASHAITLTPAMVNNAVQWTMEYDGKSGNSPSTYPVISLAAKEEHTLTYTIANPAGLSINFDPSMVTSGGKSIHNALWMKSGSKPHSAKLSNQITDVSLTSPTVLVFKDENSGNPQTLVYQINFVDASNSSAKVTALDPDLKNGGGNNNLQSYALEIAVVAGVLLVAALLFRRFNLRRRQANPN